MGGVDFGKRKKKRGERVKKPRQSRIFPSLLEGGNDGDTADKTEGSDSAEDGEGAFVDTKETKVVNDAREDQFGRDENGGRGSGTEGGDGQDGDGDIDGTEDTTRPGPDGGFCEHDGQVCWWAAPNFDHEVDEGCHGTFFVIGEIGRINNY